LVDIKRQLCGIASIDFHCFVLISNPRLHPKTNHQNLSPNTEYGICSKAVIIGVLRGEFTGFMACKAASEFANKTHLKICSKRR